MSAGEPQQRDSDVTGPPQWSGGQGITYCIVPADLAGELHELLERHFRDDRGVEVIVERRGRERRSEGERRAITRPGEWGHAAAGGERRRIRSEEGRRAGERRATAEIEPPTDLPRRVRRQAARLRFVRRLVPADEHAEDLDTARIVACVQAGEKERFGDLYTRYFTRVFGYMRLLLRSTQDAEDATQEVFVRALEGLPKYERRKVPFRAWLFTIGRNYAISQLRKEHDVALDPEELDRRREENGLGLDLDAMRAASNRDFLILIERLPVAQRQVMALRFMLDLNSNEIATITGREPGAVRALHHRAMQALKARFEAKTQGAERPRRAPMKAWTKRAPVLRSRKYSL